jgi:hypothetical protein
LLLAIASAVILSSESLGAHDHVLLSQIRDSSKPGGLGPRIYIPQEQGGPVIPPGTGFPFRHLLLIKLLNNTPRYLALAWTASKTSFPLLLDSSLPGKHAMDFVRPS